ncbi:MAG: hypothetical protein ABJB97_08070 [Acidobacteriota bacterium]
MVLEFGRYFARAFAGKIRLAEDGSSSFFPTVPQLQLRDRLVFDPGENTLFNDLAGLRIENREQGDEIYRVSSETLKSHGRRSYSIVNYEGPEIAPEIMV